MSFATSVFAAKQDDIPTQQRPTFIAYPRVQWRLVSHRRCNVSTLSEIAMNHAKMAKGLAEHTAEPPLRQPVVVGGFEISALELTQPPCNVEVQERYLDQPCLAAL